MTDRSRIGLIRADIQLFAPLPPFVTIEDNVYDELTETTTRVNAVAEQIHGTAVACR